MRARTSPQFACLSLFSELSRIFLCATFTSRSDQNRCGFKTVKSDLSEWASHPRLPCAPSSEAGAAVQHRIEIDLYQQNTTKFFCLVPRRLPSFSLPWSLALCACDQNEASEEETESSLINNVIQWNPDITILDITMDILCPGKSYSKMYGTEPRYNDIPDITMRI